MQPTTCPLWCQVLELSVHLYRIAYRWAAACREEYPAGGGRFYLGQRVRTTVPELGAFGKTPAPAGTYGVVSKLPTPTDPDYGVVLDTHPDHPHYFGDDELAAS